MTFLRSLVRVAAPGVILLLALVLAAGCKTVPKVDWASRVGVYTYDQSVIDMGPPDKMATLTDGSIVAEWVMRQGGYYGTGGGFVYGAPYRSYGYRGGYVAGTSYVEKAPNTYLRLIFDPEGKLASWTEFQK